MSKTCLHISFAVILTLFVVNLKISKGATIYKPDGTHLKAQDFNFNANKGTNDHLMFESPRTVYVIKCVIPVNLIFTATDKPRGVLVNHDEVKELCRTMPLDLQKRRKRSLLQSDLPKIWGALPVFEKTLTCKWFVVISPRAGKDMSDTIIDCVPDQYID